MLIRIRHILEMIRFSHTLFALPFALLAAIMAWRANWTRFHDETLARSIPIVYDGRYETPDKIISIRRGAGLLDPVQPHFRWQELVGILMCMVTGRSAAMSFNRLADRRIDALNPRTANRHLPAGTLTVFSVGMFAAMSSSAFIASTLMFLPNRLPLYLSVPVLLFLLGYSYTKRFTMLSHLWLGASLGLAPVMAWIAIRGQTVMENPRDLLPAVLLGGAVMFWVAGFDIIYACQDADFDRQHGLHSIPARLGVKMSLDLAATFHLLMVVLLLLLPLVYPLFGFVWFVGIAAIAGLLVYEHRLVKPNDLARVNTAFFNVNVVVSVGLLIVGAASMW
jgi:4-hydroxybenzoate polyprenyltransferase